MDQIICPHCKTANLPTAYFCSNCGKVIQEKPITLGKQLYIYFVSIFFPPFGLVYGVRYLRQSDQKMKKVGWAAIILTIISLIITIWLTVGVLNATTKSLDSQLNNYRNLGL